ncbi:group 1 truncated hemoglobin [Lentisphaera profundi]|uniref:Group 1 truncated hemoglobin n=1 Tax=Lentisphaera profundi TaxID=1658616 RepID=A0ABY7VS41_9BACT|nr:group 1 truncated hemoglobin [Lentisphaera profundi]WDE97025.1 group 1 truncated hemoglobin [Lentisphaera profundi]
MQKLFDKIGGLEGIEKFLDSFYQIVLSDERVKDYFKNIDLVTLKSHQSFFLSYVFGGVPEYTRLSLRESHLNLKITHEGFDATVEDMITALEIQKVDSETINEVATILESTRQDIVTI